MSALVQASAAALALRGGAAGTRRLYGVVDAARSVELAYAAKTMFGADMQSLFLPDLHPHLWNVAPYLVPVEPQSGYLDHWAPHWDKNVGVLLVSAAPPDTLHEHLRKIFVVRDEQGQEYFFRFYDPRVLRGFLPTCSPAQLAEFFGPVDAFMAPTEGAGLATFSVSAGKLVVDVRDDAPVTATGTTGSVR